MIKEDVFENDHLWRAMFKMTIPTIFSSLFIVIYNLVDVFWIGQTGDANQISALVLAMPVFMFMMALGNMLGVGGSSYIARLLGKKDFQTIKKTSAFCFYFSLVLGLLTNICMVWGMPYLLKMLGTSSATSGFTEAYLTVVAYGCYALIFQTAFSFIVRSEGASKESMIGMVIGTVVNIILDPVCILYFGWGVQGVAIATIIGAFTSCLYFVWYMLKHSTNLSMNLYNLRLKGSIIREVIFVGLPASISQIFMCISHVVLNNFLAKYGDMPIASMGVALRIYSFVPIVNIGFATGVAPLLGYNLGSGNLKRLKAILYRALGLLFGMGLIFLFLFEVMASGFISVMTDNAEIQVFSTYILRAVASTAPLLAVFFLAKTTLQALGRAIEPLILSVSRQGLIFMPTVIFFNKWFGLTGIVWAQPVADVFSMTMGVWMVFYFLHKESQKFNILKQRR
ncbi:MAG: MATE family efflux transporter [Alphaproteobacteria bacterium]|nr:MATE family efflux transporter [Alphaproteobacteria bacterium]